MPLGMLCGMPQGMLLGTLPGMLLGIPLGMLLDMALGIFSRNTESVQASLLGMHRIAFRNATRNLSRNPFGL